jgi:hypothetical protein
MDTRPAPLWEWVVAGLLALCFVGYTWMRISAEILGTGPFPSILMVNGPFGVVPFGSQ